MDADPRRRGGVAAEKVLEGQGSRQRTGSIVSQGAVRGARVPGWRSATSKVGAAFEQAGARRSGGRGRRRGEATSDRRP